MYGTVSDLRSIVDHNVHNAGNISTYVCICFYYIRHLIAFAYANTCTVTMQV